MNHLLRYVLFLALVAAAPLLRAEDIGAVQKRMQSRLAQVDQLKLSGLAGENNLGLLEARGAVSAEQDKVVSDENGDRRTVYAELAKRNNTSVEQVGRLRAKKIAEISAPGIWLQDERGSWYKK